MYHFILAFAILYCLYLIMILILTLIYHFIFLKHLIITNNLIIIIFLSLISDYILEDNSKSDLIL